ncbi:homocysteine S-methyltransferase family protein [Granulosicoccus sp. 3-233]|uniref:homocysteine S-methyltransferase family protein n=1 Tax=Granulosicoccus sp. 3-233 TaxID=3417969 RepID=UPI003D342E39
MAHSHTMPQLGHDLYLSYMGAETDLKFNHGVDLPGFASYPLLESENGRDMLRGYYSSLIELAQQFKVGVIIDSATWVANRDRGAQIGQSRQSLERLNLDAIELIVQIREQHDDVPIVLCGQVGPRGDGYAPEELMTADEAENYHDEQIETLSRTDADFICATTLCYPEEAIGIVRSGKTFGKPVAISFTVEKNGCLPTGISLKNAIIAVDEATDTDAIYFMVNCAHPDHFTHVLADEPWFHRVKGLVVNASRCSHAELDEAVSLDHGDPVELGAQLADLRRMFPHLSILGGCCGTDMRHMKCIAEQAKAVIP